jgi:hypothetical protein
MNVTTDSPTLHVQYGVRQCSSGTGAFRIDELHVLDTGVNGLAILHRLTAAFWLQCEGDVGILRGCVRYAP